MNLVLDGVKNPVQVSFWSRVEKPIANYLMEGGSIDLLPKPSGVFPYREARLQEIRLSIGTIAVRADFGKGPPPFGDTPDVGSSLPWRSPRMPEEQPGIPGNDVL